MKVKNLLKRPLAAVLAGVIAAGALIPGMVSLNATSDGEARLEIRSGVPEMTYEISPAAENGDGDPVQAGYAVRTQDGAASVFEGMLFTEPGTYAYRVVPLPPESGEPGVVYDSSVHEVTVKVSESLSTSVSDRKLSFLDRDGRATVDAAPSASMQLDGRPLADGMFRFELRPVSAEYEMENDEAETESEPETETEPEVTPEVTPGGVTPEESTQPSADPEQTPSAGETERPSGGQAPGGTKITGVHDITIVAPVVENRFTEFTFSWSFVFPEDAETDLEPEGEITLASGLDHVFLDVPNGTDYVFVLSGPEGYAFEQSVWTGKVGVQEDILIAGEILKDEESAAETGSESEAESETEGEAESEAESESESESAMESEAESEAVIDSEPESEAESEAVAESSEDDGAVAAVASGTILGAALPLGGVLSAAGDALPVLPPMPDGSTDGEAMLVTNTASGTVTFGSITFDRPGTYVYELRQTVPEVPEDGWFYDESVYTVTILVEEDVDGNLLSAVSYAEDGAAGGAGTCEADGQHA